MSLSKFVELPLESRFEILMRLPPKDFFGTGMLLFKDISDSVLSQDYFLKCYINKHFFKVDKLHWGVQNYKEMLSSPMYRFGHKLLSKGLVLDGIPITYKSLKLRKITLDTRSLNHSSYLYAEGPFPETCISFLCWTLEDTTCENQTNYFEGIRIVVEDSTGNIVTLTQKIFDMSSLIKENTAFHNNAFRYLKMQDYTKNGNLLCDHDQWLGLEIEFLFMAQFLKIETIEDVSQINNSFEENLSILKFVDLQSFFDTLSVNYYNLPEEYSPDFEDEMSLFDPDNVEYPEFKKIKSVKAEMEKNFSLNLTYKKVIQNYLEQC
jgi:hypothetical protein